MHKINHQFFGKMSRFSEVRKSVCFKKRSSLQKDWAQFYLYDQPLNTRLLFQIDSNEGWWQAKKYQQQHDQTYLNWVAVRFEARKFKVRCVGFVVRFRLHVLLNLTDFINYIPW